MSVTPFVEQPQLRCVCSKQKEGHVQFRLRQDGTIIYRVGSDVTEFTAYSGG